MKLTQTVVTFELIKGKKSHVTYATGMTSLWDRRYSDRMRKVKHIKSHKGKNPNKV